MHYPENKDFQTILNKVEGHLTNDLPFSIYRKPKEETLTGVFQSDDNLNLTEGFKERGFVFAPFSAAEQSVLIQPDEVLKAVYRYEGNLMGTPIPVSDKGKEHHINLVQKGIDEIKKGNLKKVVLSRKIEVRVTHKVTSIFQTLLERYPNAFCYLFHHPKVGTWCGATPETLVRVKGQEMHTMSLAATLPVEQNELPKWGSKEIEEQKMVSDYIGEKLSKSIEELQIGNAESVRAGNLWHLRSEIKGKLSNASNIKYVIRSLHPTPAVCGIPTEDAKDFILENEGYQRTFYTGFLGGLKLDSNDEISLFVNLRCMEIKDGKASIFVGGGITAASDPESEWIETQNKSKTMLSIL